MSRTTLPRRMQTFQNVLGHWHDACLRWRRRIGDERAELPATGAATRTMAWTEFDRRLARRPRAACRPTGSGDEPAIRAGQALPRPSLRPPWLRLELHLDRRSAQAWCPGTQARRPPSPAPAQALRRHDAPPGRLDELAARPDRHHGRHQRNLFGLPGRGGRPASTFRSRCSRQGAAQQPLYRPRQLLPHPRGRRQGRQGSTHPGRPRPPPARHRAHRIRPRRGRFRHPPGPPRQGTGVGADGRSRDAPDQPLRHPARARRQRLRAPRPPRPGRRHPLPAHRAHSPRQHRALRKARPPDPRHPSQTPLVKARVLEYP